MLAFLDRGNIGDANFADRLVELGSTSSKPALNEAPCAESPNALGGPSSQSLDQQYKCVCGAQTAPATLPRQGIAFDKIRFAAQTKHLLSLNSNKPAPRKPALKARAAEERGRKFLSEEKVLDIRTSRHLPVPPPMAPRLCPVLKAHVPGCLLQQQTSLNPKDECSCMREIASFIDPTGTPSYWRSHATIQRTPWSPTWPKPGDAACARRLCPPAPA
ncbi:hypothetical protein GGR53DRAFT_468483 [Hypoxylon sp. FL1150]|nr:hypothetical protein GGR53DRAFT_468483 [Hypoxylon sp. FL1150]